MEAIELPECFRQKALPRVTGGLKNFMVFKPDDIASSQQEKQMSPRHGPIGADRPARSGSREHGSLKTQVGGFVLKNFRTDRAQ
ncbi:MAG: hypothetical protein WCA15_03755 [Candidatus Acidiferrales bacterium]